jgi:hypothetical protein
MPAYTITAVDPNPPRQWSSQKGGPMLSYRVDLQRDEDQFAIRNVEWSRKQASPAPTVGQKLNCTVDMEAQYGPKLKVEQEGGGFGGGRGGGMTPEREAQIIRQHSQHMALLHVGNLVAAGKVENAPTSWEQLVQIIDKFDTDAKAAKP